MRIPFLAISGVLQYAVFMPRCR